MIIEMYAQVPTELMVTSIPLTDPPIPFSTVDGRQKTLREFIFTYLTWDLHDGTTVFRLACDQSGRGQRFKRGTNEEDMIDWDGFLTPYGYGEDTWLTREEAERLIPQPELG